MAADLSGPGRGNVIITKVTAGVAILAGVAIGWTVVQWGRIAPEVMEVAGRAGAEYLRQTKITTRGPKLKRAGHPHDCGARPECLAECWWLHPEREWSDLPGAGRVRCWQYPDGSVGMVDGDADG
jgi:hypothetical protein